MRHITKIVISLGLLASAAGAAPMPRVAEPWQWGKASWYGYECVTSHRGTMANGRRFNPRAQTAASWVYPLGSILLVTNQANGRRVAVMVTDRGPAQHLGRLLDLSESAATALDYRHDGLATVAVRVLVLPENSTSVPLTQKR